MGDNIPLKASLAGAAADNTLVEAEAAEAAEAVNNISVAAAEGVSNTPVAAGKAAVGEVKPWDV